MNEALDDILADLSSCRRRDVWTIFVFLNVDDFWDDFLFFFYDEVEE